VQNFEEWFAKVEKNWKSNFIDINWKYINNWKEWFDNAYNFEEWFAIVEKKWK